MECDTFLDFLTRRCIMPSCSRIFSAEKKLYRRDVGQMSACDDDSRSSARHFKLAGMSRC